MPFCTKCGTEIQEEFKFCTACGTEVAEEQVSETTSKKFWDKVKEIWHKVGELWDKVDVFFSKIGLISGAFLCIYYSGWKLVWGIVIWGGLVSDDFIFNTSSILLRFNDAYYGLLLTNRFFDSPTISWFLGASGIGLVITFFKVIFGDIFGDE